MRIKLGFQKNIIQRFSNIFNNDPVLRWDSISRHQAETISPDHATRARVGCLHNPTDISENCVVQHLKVSYDTIFTDRIYPVFAVQHNLLDCVNRLN
jgi:hypothetical protein